jgi:hypothetical protein
MLPLLLTAIVRLLARTLLTTRLTAVLVKQRGAQKATGLLLLLLVSAESAARQIKAHPQAMVPPQAAKARRRVLLPLQTLRPRQVQPTMAAKVAAASGARQRQLRGCPGGWHRWLLRSASAPAATARAGAG